jgi:hypothetical protein
MHCTAAPPPRQPHPPSPPLPHPQAAPEELLPALAATMGRAAELEPPHQMLPRITTAFVTAQLKVGAALPARLPARLRACLGACVHAAAPVHCMLHRAGACWAAGRQ